MSPERTLKARIEKCLDSCLDASRRCDAVEEGEADTVRDHLGAAVIHLRQALREANALPGLTMDQLETWVKGMGGRKVRRLK